MNQCKIRLYTYSGFRSIFAGVRALWQGLSRHVAELVRKGSEDQNDFVMLQVEEKLNEVSIRVSECYLKGRIWKRKRW